MKKRKDLKGRVLLTGETQETSGTNKGRYSYFWTDANGKRQRIYSWRLTAADPTPQKCRKEQVPLRTQEAQIKADINNGIDSVTAKRMTLNDSWDKYIGSRHDLKERTVYSYKKRYDKLVRNSIGERTIKDIKFSDMRKFYSDLLEDGNKTSSVSTLNALIEPVFTVAVRDGLIYTNPCNGVLTDLRKSYNKKPENAPEKRFALTLEEQTAFLSFVKDSNRYRKYYDFFVIAFGTGMRIGELAALRWADIDTENNLIHVNHSVARYPGEDTSVHISEPKTVTSKRTIPILPEVKAALTRQKERTGFLKDKCVIDGFNGFVFLNARDTILETTCINDNIENIVNAYTAVEEKKATAECRKPLLIRHFSMHIIRHTFITRLIEQDVNPKVVQVIAGHSNINTTMDIYTEVHESKKKSALNQIDIGLAME